MRFTRPRAKRQSAPRWAGITDTDLLEWRFCDLRLSLAESPLQSDIENLHATLMRRGIRFKPHVWLSTEWFSPDGIPGIAVPFYAAHPRLAQLERRQKGEAEGSNRYWRRRILRHEAGHALDTAFALRRRADWRAVFGKASKRYPVHYRARPGSRKFVQHLGHWYAQSHPTEDFAETFAVWLQPKATWRQAYSGWGALRKLEYVDSLMSEIAGRRPIRCDRTKVATLAANRRTLREHYRRQSARADLSDRRYDDWLNRTFAERRKLPTAPSAGAFLGDIERRLRQRVLENSTGNDYLFSHVAASIRHRVRELDLVLRTNRRKALPAVVRLHVRVVEDILRRNRERFVV